MKRPACALAAALAGGAVLSPVGAVSAHGKKPTAVKVRKAPLKVPLRPYADHTRAAAQGKGLHPSILHAVFHAESRHNPKAHNKRTDAAGIGQHTRGGRRAVERLRRANGAHNWRYTRADAFDPIKAIWATAELLAHLVDQCGTLVRALGAYATGQCGKGLSYASRVLRMADHLRAAEEPRS